MSHFAKTDAGRALALGMQALQRIGKPSDVADVIAFLASDRARWITGATIPVDGGVKAMNAETHFAGKARYCIVLVNDRWPA